MGNVSQSSSDKSSQETGADSARVQMVTGHLHACSQNMRCENKTLVCEQSKIEIDCIIWES